MFSLSCITLHCVAHVPFSSCFVLLITNSANFASQTQEQPVNALFTWGRDGEQEWGVKRGDSEGVAGWVLMHLRFGSALQSRSYGTMIHVFKLNQ